MSDSEKSIDPNVVVSDEDKARAEELKALGNGKFGKHQYQEAVDFYTQAIELNPAHAVYHSNRAFASLRLGEFGATISDATNALTLDARSVKSYYRRGSAYLALGKHDEALRDFKRCCKLSPKDPDARKRLKEVERTLYEKKFLEAIAAGADKEKQVWAACDPESVQVEDGYDGPRIDPDKGVDMEFCRALMDWQRSQKKVHRKYVMQILREVRDLLETLPTLVEVPVPEDSRIVVCGDVHGQYYDFLNIFELHGYPSEENPFLFNGDFVDRGSFSVEIILALFALKLALPGHLHLNRGNHETISMNKVYGFEGEVRAKYSSALFPAFTSCFQHLPLCHVLGSKVFVVHGGLFEQDGVTLDDIRAIDRKGELENGLGQQMIWSDPMPAPGRAPSKRGVGCQFGPDVAKRFLDENGLSMMIRSHEVKPEGYEVLEGSDGRVVTVFSSPAYCGQLDNKGAVAIIRGGGDMMPEYKSFEAVASPSVPAMAYANPSFGFF